MTLHPHIDVLLQNLERAFDRRSWHGPNLKGSVRGLNIDEATWRPQSERHNIWEYVVHAAYWKYRIIRLVDSSVTGSFGMPGSNFFKRPIDRTDAALKQDIRMLIDWHAKLLHVVESLEPELLSDTPGSSKFTRRDLLLGAAAHDVYHSGQIRLLRRMWAERN